MEISTLISLIVEELDWQKKMHQHNPNFSPDFYAAFRAAGHKCFLPDSCYQKSWMNAVRREMIAKGLLSKKAKEKKTVNVCGGTWHDKYPNY